MFFPQPNKSEPSPPPAFEFKFRLSETTLVKLAPYIVALLVGGTGYGWIVNQINLGDKSTATFQQPTQPQTGQPEAAIAQPQISQQPDCQIQSSATTTLESDCLNQASLKSD